MKGKKFHIIRVWWRATSQLGLGDLELETWPFTTHVNVIGAWCLMHPFHPELSLHRLQMSGCCLLQDNPCVIPHTVPRWYGFLDSWHDSSLPHCSLLEALKIVLQWLHLGATIACSKLSFNYHQSFRISQYGTASPDIRCGEQLCTNMHLKTGLVTVSPSYKEGSLPKLFVYLDNRNNSHCYWCTSHLHLSPIHAIADVCVRILNTTLNQKVVCAMELLQLRVRTKALYYIMWTAKHLSSA